VRSVPDTVATKAESVEPIGLSVSGQMATVVREIIVPLVLHRLLDLIPTAESVGIEESVAIEVEGDRIVSGGDSRECVFVPGVVESPVVDGTLGFRVLNVRKAINNLEELNNGVTNQGERIVQTVSLVAESVEGVDSNKGIPVITSNLATIMPKFKATNEPKDRAVIVAILSIEVILAGASSSIAGPTNIANVVN